MQDDEIKKTVKNFEDKSTKKKTLLFYYSLLTVKYKGILIYVNN